MQKRRGQAILQYALLAAVLAVAMLASLSFTRTTAGNNIARTQTGLSNETNAP
jgi:Flp pilus assembly pilin Flp